MSETKIYICPTCNKEFYLEDEIVKHYLKCWKQLNPHQKSKHIENSEDINITRNDEEINNFFKSFREDNYL